MANGKIQRITPQRRMIQEVLDKPDYHPTAAELYEDLRRRLPRISLGTVYRNLDLLVRNGLINKLDMGSSKSRYDGNTKKHHHIRCVSCHRMDDINALPAGQTEPQIKEIRGYRILDHHFEFVGLCPSCRNRQNAGEEKRL
ncbi:MAG: transcriptional repressor [FCB group bacterium]|nr:transcriptional repressor [FCB group bacterium]